MNATAESQGSDDGALRSFAGSRLGQILGGRWTLTEVLGVGGTSCVYAATHRNGARVAIKLLHPELARIARLRRRFLAEGHAANCVGHPGVVAVFDEAEEADGTAFLVMELLHGQSLDRLLSERGKLPWPEVAQLTIGILDVLAAAHDQRVLHRDLKPSNVFLTRAGQIKLLDFGTAKVQSWQREQFITRSGTTLGTPAFMAPELAAGCLDDVDALTDIWAVGATMFQLLSNRTVHLAFSAQEAIVAAATQPAPRIHSLCQQLPQALADIVDRALAYEKCDRFPNARAMQAELRAVLAVATPTLLGLATGPEMTTPELDAGSATGVAAASRGWPWHLLLFGGLVLAVFLTWPRRSVSPPSAARTGEGSSAPPAMVPPRSSNGSTASSPSATAAPPAGPVSSEPRRRLAPAKSARAPALQSRALPKASPEPSSDGHDLLDRWP